MSDHRSRDELVSRIEDLEESLAEAVEYAAKERARTRRILSEAETEIRNDLREEQNARGREDAKLARRLSETEDRLDIDASEAFATADGGQEVSHLTPLQRLIRHGPAGAVEHPTTTHERAREIALNFGRWGQRIDDSYGKRTKLSVRKHALKGRLEDKLDEQLQWNQVHRAMQKVAELSDGRVELIDPEESAEGSYALLARYDEITGAEGERG